MSIKQFLILGIITLCGAVVGGCAGKPQALYDYGGYSDAYYIFKKEPGEKSMGEFKSSIEDVIEKSDANAMRVPPGMFANLGYIYLKMNNPARAVENFEKEKAIYPEARHFMDRMIRKTEMSLQKNGSGHD